MIENKSIIKKSSVFNRKRINQIVVKGILIGLVLVVQANMAIPASHAAFVGSTEETDGGSSIEITPETWTRHPNDKRVDDGNFDRWSPVQNHTDFLEMRLALEQLTGSQVKGLVVEDGVSSMSVSGPLFLGLWKEERSNRYWEQLLGNTAMSAFYTTKYALGTLKEKATTDKLAEIAKSTFSDIKGDEWFAPWIPVSVYFDVVNGYPDGTFQGNKTVSFGETCAMIDNSMYHVSRETLEGLGSIVESMMEGNTNVWYINYLQYYISSSIYCRKIDFNKTEEGMTRGAVADMIACTFFPGEFKDEFLNKLKEGESTLPFKDIETITKSTVKTDTFFLVGDYDVEDAKQSYVRYMEQVNKENGVKECPLNVAAALKVMNDKGIIVGDQYGNSNWNQVVTRAEMLVILQRLAECRSFYITIG